MEADTRDAISVSVRARSPSPAAGNPNSVIGSRSSAMANNAEVMSRTQYLQQQLQDLRQKTEQKLHKYENIISNADRGQELLDLLSQHVAFLRDRSNQLANTVRDTGGSYDPTTRSRSPPRVAPHQAPQVLHRQLQV